jgi:hypothetical protein
LSGEGMGALVAGGLATVTSPFWAPPLLLGDDYVAPAYFTPYPYSGMFPGFLSVNEVGDPGPLSNWSVRGALEDGNDFRGLNRLGGRLVLDTTSRFGGLTNWNYFNENLGNGHTDETLIGDTNLTFRFAQSERVQMHTGLGLRLQTNRYDTRFGANFTYGADFFPARPVVVSAAFDAGNLSDTLVLHARATVGLVYGRWEGFVGYDFLRVNSANLQGMLAGLRLWF